MKYYSLIIFILSFTTFIKAQTPDCSGLVKFTEGDRGGYNRETITLPGMEIRVRNVKLSYMVVLITLTDKTKCFERGKPVVFVFEDNSRVEMPNDNDLPCSNEGLINLGGQHKHLAELQQLKSNLVRTIKILSKEGIIESNFSKDEQGLFRDVMNCLAGKL